MLDALTFQAEALKLEKLMYHISWSLLRNADDCADAVQEALARAWQKRASLRDAAHFKPWLMRILVNQCNDMLRRQKRRGFAPLEEAADETRPFPMEQLSLRETMAHMKPELRLVIVLHYLEGCTVEEIARITRTPAGTVKSRMKRARKELGDLLQDEWKEAQA